MKKLTITFIFSLGLIGTLFTACFCKDVQPYWKPKSGSINLYSSLDGSLEEVSAGDTVQADSLAVILQYEAEYVASKYNPFAQLGNIARATQKCPVDGHAGLKRKATSISITSNESYNGLNAGEELSQFFKYNGESIQISYLNELNQFGYEYVAYGFNREMYWVIPPNNSIERNLIVKVNFEGGETVTMQTNDFTW